MPRKKKEDVKSQTKGEALVEFVLNRYNYSKTNMADRHAKWKEYYDDYRGTRSDAKEDWQANYVVTSLKEAVRTKTPKRSASCWSARSCTRCVGKIRCDTCYKKGSISFTR